jgi:hypothetical protein
MLELWEEITSKERLQSSKKQRDRKEKKNQEEIVTSDVFVDALIIFLDSGASFNSTPYMKNFLDYVQGYLGQVHLGDDAL